MILRYKGLERRKFIRINLNFIIVCRLRRSVNVTMRANRRDIDALIVDLSEAGMAFSVDRSVPLATKFSIRFILIKVGKHTGSGYKPITLDGRVRSCVLIEKERYRLGVSFTRITKQDKTTIIDFMKHVTKPKV